MEHQEKRKNSEKIKGKWYSARHVKEAWNYLIKYLDGIFKDCDVVYSDKSQYDLSQHRIYIKRRQNFNKVHFVIHLLEMILINLIPGIKKVMYQDKIHFLVSKEEVDRAAARYAMKIYPRLNSGNTGINLDKYLKRIHTSKKTEEQEPLSREELSYMYYQKELSTYQIAALIGTTRHVIERWMDNYNLPRRRKGNYKHISPEKLYKLYYVQDFTLEEIGKILGVNKMTVLRKMKEYKMDRRDKDFTTQNLNYREKAFRSVLRKRIRRNPYYIEVISDVLEQAKKDPDFYNVEDDRK